MLNNHFGIVQFQTFGKNTFAVVHVNIFVISVPKCPTHYSPTGNGIVLKIVVHQNIRLSRYCLRYPGHLPMVFYVLDQITTKQQLEPPENFIDWEQFQSLASNLI
jgi:hypothetical protein